MGKSTNLEIFKALASGNKKIARLAEDFGIYDENGELTDFDFNKFAEGDYTPEQNEFLTTMFNKIMVQRVFDPLKGWENPFAKLFTKDKPYLGSSEEWLSVDCVSAESYDVDGEDLLEVVEPTINVQYITSTDKKKYRISLTREIIARAFTTEYGLGDLLSQVQGKLRKSKEIYMYGVVNTTLASITKYKVLTAPISGLNDAENARKCYEEILKLVADLTIPNTTYNVNGKLTTTNKGEAILVINTAYKASFDVNVLASLLNSNVVGENKYFKAIIEVAQPTDATCVGYILDPDAIIITNDILRVDSFYNADNMVTTSWLHNWTKVNVNNAVNALKLLTTAPL